MCVGGSGTDPCFGRLSCRSHPQTGHPPSHPDTSFCELRPHHPPAKKGVYFYVLFLSGYANSPKEKLLELMAYHHDIAKLCELP
jgi:hypothetical protein